jgi:hypothetical protein
LDSADSRQHGFADAIGSTATVPAMDQNQIRLVNRSGVNPGARILLHLALAALPLLAISAQVFGLLTMRIAAALVIIPLAMVVGVVSVFAPHASDRITGYGFLWGTFACVVYDVFRLDTVYILGWWGDFIPRMGTWVIGHPGSSGGAVVGYLWRYIGDGGGIGIAFFVVAGAVGLDRCRRSHVVLGAIAFAVFPVWAGLIGTVALAPQGQSMMFPLTATTVTLSLIGHLIFGAVLGLGLWQVRDVYRFWSWRPIGSEFRIPSISEFVVPTQGRHSARATRTRLRVGNEMSRATYEQWQQRRRARNRPITR